jgi:hypothetical protein
MEDTGDLINLEGENEKTPCEVFILNFNQERSGCKRSNSPGSGHCLVR